MKLHEVIALLKATKTTTYSRFTELHKESQRAETYSGLRKEYFRSSEDGEELPNEVKRVGRTSSQVLAEVQETLTDLFNYTSQQENGNQHAKATVTVNGRVILKDAPVTYLLFLEKQLTDLRTFITKMPVLDENKDWTLDPASGIYRTEKVRTTRTKRVQRPIVKYDAVIKEGVALPAQTEMITDDIPTGVYETTQFSGALPSPRKKELLRRVDLLIQSVKVARSEANDTKAPEVKVAGAIFDYLFE